MEYINYKRFKQRAICGDVNIPAMTILQSDGKAILYNGKPLCGVTSENAYKFFAINEDGMGMKRGKLTQAIQKALAKRDDDYQKRWDKVWDDEICQRYKRKEHSDHWLWSREFFEADIDSLEHIARLVDAKA